MGILEVEVEIAGLYILDCNPPGMLIHDPLLPPGLLGGELLDADGLGLVVRLHALGVGVLVVPELLGWPALGEEEEVGAYARVGVEDPVGQADDGVEIALAQELFLDAGLHPLAEKRAVGEDQSRSAPVLEDPHDEDEEEIGGLAGSELGREVGFDPILFHPAERRIGHDDIHPFLWAPVAQGAREGVAVLHPVRNVYAVEEEVRDAEDVGQVLLLYAPEGLLHGELVGICLRLFSQVIDGRGEKASRTAGWVENDLPQTGVHLIHDELSHGAGRVELAGVSGGLKVLENLLINIAEEVAVRGCVEVDAVDLVHDLAHEGAVLHVVVGVIEGRADEGRELGIAASGKGLELGQERVVHEVQELPPRDALLVRGPGRPAQVFGDGRLVVAAQEGELLLPVVEYLEEEHPAEDRKSVV